MTHASEEEEEEEEGLFKADAVNEEDSERDRARRRRGSFERRCLLTTDDADLVEISSVFNHFLWRRRASALAPS
jgi:hypothetical protein